MSVRHVFTGQYLWLQARRGGAVAPGRGPGDGLGRLARDFAHNEQDLLGRWRGLVRTWARSGNVAVWGAGAKGVTFCNLVDPRQDALACVIDVNPAKQGKYVAGAGHPIIGPDQLDAQALAAVLVLNPTYTAEIAERLQRLGAKAVVVDAMRGEELRPCA
jgi:hypothetical protein